MLRITREERRSFFENTALALVLCTVAGAVNASGLLAAGAMTSHMTGNLTRVGEGLALASAEWQGPARYFAFFLLGAFVSSVGVNLVRRRVREPVPAMLLAEAAMLVAVAEAGWQSRHPALVTEVLCFAMGWQNALITRISGAVVRTTHMTGCTTDLGIELGQLVCTGPGLGDAIREKGLWRALREVPVDSDLGRAGLHATAIVCFFLGALAGPLLFVRFGYPAMIGPALLLVLLVIVDRLGRATTRPAGPPAPAR